MNGNQLDLNEYGFKDQVVVNFVVSGDGEYKDENGSSRGVSNSIDRQLLVYLRSQTNAVLVGGETARKEKYQPDNRFETFVFTKKPEDFDKDLKTITVLNDEQLTNAVADIASSHGGLLVEAGPKLVSKLVSLGLVDIFCLTVINPQREIGSILKQLFNLENAQLVSRQEIEDTVLTIWRPTSV